MQLFIESIIKHTQGYYEVSILFPPGKLYSYKVKSKRDIDKLKYYISRGYTGNAVRLIKTFELIRKGKVNV